MPGEAAVIAAALKHAGRFKQVSLPVLWEISRDASAHERTRTHALRVAWEIYRAERDRDGLRRLLAEKGMGALAEKLASLR